MDFLFFIVLIFIVLSWVSGSAGKAARSNPNARLNGRYQRTQTGSSTAGTDRFPKKDVAPTGDWMSQLQSLEAKLTQAARVPSGKQSKSTGRSNSANRFNNSPVAKSQFHNHTESQRFLSEEITESRVLWAMNHQEQDRINQAFNQYVLRQHQENQRMMQHARSLDR